MVNGEQKAPEAFSMFQRRGGLWLVCISLWAVAAMLFAGQGYLGRIIYSGETPPAIHSSGWIGTRVSNDGEVQKISKRRPFSYYLLREAEVWRELYKDHFSLALTSLVPRGVAVRVVLPFRMLTEDTGSAMGCIP